MKHVFDFHGSFKINNRGFTLVELMVVVAIIGILSAIGIPTFKKYQAKSRAAEAKTMLAAAYSAEIAFQAEYDTFANCFPVMGFDPTANSANRYYAVGDDGDYGQNAIARANGASTCASFAYGDGGGQDYTHFHPGKTVNPSFTPDNGAYCMVGVQSGPASAADGSTFNVEVMGFVMQGATRDMWKINQNKNLVHIAPYGF